MKFTQFVLIVTVLISLHIHYTATAAQAEEHLISDRQSHCNNCAHRLLNSSRIRHGQLRAFVSRFPETVGTINNPSTWPIHQGQTLAHFLVNQQRFDAALTLVAEFDETLNVPSTDQDQSKPGSTAFLALCYKAPSQQRMINLQLTIADRILHRYPHMAQQQRRFDGMTPFLAAACVHNMSLMRLIHQHCPDAYRQSTSCGDDAACLMAIARTNINTTDNILSMLQIAPYLLTPRLIVCLIAGCKIHTLRELSQRTKDLSITDTDIINAWQRALSKNSSNWLKLQMHRFLISEFPQLALHLPEISPESSRKKNAAQMTPINHEHFFYPTQYPPQPPHPIDATVYREENIVHQYQQAPSSPPHYPSSIMNALDARSMSHATLPPAYKAQQPSQGSPRHNTYGTDDLFPHDDQFFRAPSPTPMNSTPKPFITHVNNPRRYQ